MHNIALMRAIESSFKEKACLDAFRLLVQSYFEEYTDATELEPEAYTSLKFWFDLVFPTGDVDGLDFEQLIQKNPSKVVGQDWTE